ncbi:MAG: restriction endonuclease [Promethearchaeota archaeon]
MKVVTLGTNNEKRDALEQNVVENLQRLGWECHKNARNKSAEFDIVAYHAVYPSPLYVECKAHKGPIGADEIDKFRSKVDRLSIKVKFGWFISLAGFKGGTEHSFRDITDLKLFTGEQYIQFLIDHNLLVDQNLIKAKFHIRDDDIVESYAILRNEQCFWLFLLKGGFLVLAQAHTDAEVSPDDRNFLQNNFTEFSLQDDRILHPVEEWDILSAFLDTDPHSPPSLAENFSCLPAAVEYQLQNLEREQILIRVKDEYILNDTFSVAEKIVQKVSNIDTSHGFARVRLETEHICSFGNSPFYRQRIGQFSKKIIKKFNLEPPTPEEEGIIQKVLAISPSAIAYCLGEFDRAWEKGKFKPRVFLRHLSILVLEDSLHHRFDLFQELDEDNKLVLFNPSVEIHFARKEAPYLKLTAYPASIAMMKFKSGEKKYILRGEPLAAADDLVLCEMGLLFMHCGQFERAIECFQGNLELARGKLGALIAVVNLMCCFLNTGQPSKVIELYQEYDEPIHNASEENLTCLNESVDVGKELNRIQALFKKNYDQAQELLKS